MAWVRKAGDVTVLLLLFCLLLCGSRSNTQPLQTGRLCECSGITYHLPSSAPDWSGKEHANASADCVARGMTLPSQTGSDLSCLFEYLQYLYTFYGVPDEHPKFWLNGDFGTTGCAAYHDCMYTLIGCTITLRYVCQSVSSDPNPTTPAVPHTTVSKPTSLPDISVTYACDPGFEQSNPAVPFTSACSGSRFWSVPSLSCNITSCPAIAAPNNGMVSFSDTYNFQSLASFSCEDGYILGSSGVLACQSDKAWNDTAPSCNPMDCGSPEPVQDGNVTYSDTTFGSTANFTCNQGYKDPVSGDSHFPRTCLASGTWNTTGVVCRSLDCGKPPVLQNSVVSYESTTYRSLATYTCVEGHEKTNATIPHQAECGADGQWQSNDVSCVGVDCGTPPSLPNSDVTYTNTTYQSLATYICQVGYSNATFLHTAACLASKQWDVQNVECEIVDCGTPPTYGNSVVNFTTTTYLSVADYQCIDGREPPVSSEPYTSTCNADSQWDSIDVLCNEYHCPELAVPANAFLTFSNGTLFRAVAKFACQPGFQLVGDAVLQCQQDKLWNGSVPQCSSLVRCPDVEAPANGNVSRLLGESNEVNAVLAFRCNFGYRLNGSSTLVCTALGMWSDAIPTCEEMSVIPTTPGINSSPAAQGSLAGAEVSSVVLGVLLFLILAAVPSIWCYRNRRRQQRGYSFITEAATPEREREQFTDSSMYGEAPTRKEPTERTAMTP